MSAEVTVVDGAAMAWVNGADVFETMDPAFRDNIGQDVESALDLLSRYHARCLWKDETTGRRIDHIRCEPGYEDLSEAFHDSVEECLVLGGAVDLTAEGHFEQGDYFWRPPGWVHSAVSPAGFEALLMMEGAEPCEGSHHVSRVVRPDEEAGEHAGDADPVGPRGYVRRVESRFMPWRSHDDTGTRLSAGEDPGLRSQVLSSNADAGTETTLVRLPQGWRSTPPVRDLDLFLVTLKGRLAVDGAMLEPSGLVHVPAGTVAPALEALDDVEVMVKTSPAAGQATMKERQEQ
ncbi:cupin domain-containing protein [Nocardioides jishulii]|uniref:ChrR-like cupin domain-containing protein n=1 Tax=Nocardioides jishulii TaxID=2575440 RepID=A0A4U2YNH1_9ACTN|nr:hypothetical protein [Nocardioides jishulii]QCX27922.1 hypothetical protein FCL41_10610 [Nocardioides jishulii]TKI62728.1 hypothetical protein FC770_10275 [Nocardioides jishulii]